MNDQGDMPGPSPAVRISYAALGLIAAGPATLTGTRSAPA